MKNLGNLLGSDAATAYSQAIPLVTGIDGISILQYACPPPIQTRASLSSGELAIAAEAARTRKTEWFSYLEILLELAAKADFVAKGLLEAVDYHQENPRRRKWFDREQLENGCLVDYVNNSQSKYPLALSSRVRAKGTHSRHIPLLDFHVEKTSIGFGLAIEITQKLVGPDFLFLATDRSFHSVGLRLLSTTEYRRLLARAVLFSPVTDHAYAAHQMIEGESTLRISRGRYRTPPPIVIAVGSEGEVLTMPDLNRSGTFLKR